MDFIDNRILRLLAVLACFVVIIAGMKAASGILVPFLLALFISIISAPFLFGMQKLGIPSWLAILVILSVIIVLGVLMIGLVGASISDFTANMPSYERRIREETRELLRWVETRGVTVPEDQIIDQLNPAAAVRMVGGLLSGMGSTFSSAFLVLLIVLFMLLEAAGFPNKFKQVVGDDVTAVQGLYKAVADVRHYMAIKTVVSLLTGALITLILQLIGVSYPLMWGLIAFLFNFVPSIGSIIAAIPSVALALLELGLAPAIYTSAGYIAVNVTLGNIIEPRIVGHGLGLSPLIVILSLFFWGWVLGPIGMLLSVPLTMAMKIAMDSNESTKRIAILLGPEIRESKLPGAKAKEAEQT